MDVVNGVLNWAAMPAMVATLLLFYPPYYLFKLCYSFLSYLFPVDLKRKVVLITGASSGIGEGGGGAVARWMLPTQTVCNMGESISGRPKHDHDRPTATGRPWKA